VVTLLPASDLIPAPPDAGQDAENPLREARHSDLLVIEDLQHLPPRSAAGLARALDPGLPAENFADGVVFDFHFGVAPGLSRPISRNHHTPAPRIRERSALTCGSHANGIETS